MGINWEKIEILKQLNIVDKISDSVRIVDPYRKEVIEHKSEAILGLHCFDFWGTSKICDNCISMRAYNTNASYVKFEYTKDRIYMVTAVPYDLDGDRIVVELIKDSTNNICFGVDRTGAASSELHTLIDRLNNMSLTDALTGVFNRRYIDEKLPVDLLNAQLLSQKLSLVMLDIDWFKNINDTFGHLAGDYILKELTKRISQCVKRGSDWVARYGGEEFVVCLPGAGAQKAYEIAEIMRDAVSAAHYGYERHSIPATASFGVCCIQPDESYSPEELIGRADAKMYQAKKSGRNRVII